MPLIVKPISANLTKGREHLLFKLDPYLVLKVGNESKTTNVHKNGGKNPQWTDTLQFFSSAPEIKVYLYDKDHLSKDDLLGQGTFNLNNAYSHPGLSENQYVDIYIKGNTIGRVLISVQFVAPVKNINIQSNIGSYQKMSNMLSSQINNMNTSMNNMNNRTALNNNLNVSKMPYKNNQNYNNANFILQSQPKYTQATTFTTQIYQPSMMQTTTRTPLSSLGMSHLQNQSISSTPVFSNGQKLQSQTYVMSNTGNGVVIPKIGEQFPSFNSMQ